MVKTAKNIEPVKKRGRTLKWAEKTAVVSRRVPISLKEKYDQLLDKMIAKDFKLFQKKTT